MFEESSVPKPHIVLQQSSTHTPPHVYRNEILARLLIDLFMSKKEHPNEENHTSINERPRRVETANAENNKKGSNIRQKVR